MRRWDLDLIVSPLPDLNLTISTIYAQLLFGSNNFHISA